jgi:hypothetical protein
MIIGLFKEAIGWLVSVAEVGFVITAILLIGLALGMTGFWILSHFASKLGGPEAELDPYKDEPEETVGANVVSICPEADSPPSKLEA